MGVSLRSGFTILAAFLRLATNVVGYALVFGYAAIMFFEFAHSPHIENSRLMLEVTRLLSPSIQMVSSWFGWSWPHHGGVNIVPLILAAAAFVGRTFLSGTVANVSSDIKSRWKRVPVGAAASSQHAAALEIRGAETEKERAALLKRYRELEDALKGSARKRCSFLSIDVVGSTQMKIGETPTAIAATFQAYEEMVKQAFEAHGIWKSTWTPDGVMGCFLDRELAVRAAQKVLSSLEGFNVTHNRLQSPFKVRCGLNEGEVIIFDDSQLEKVSDRAIDIAGHMQKYAPENTLQLSEAVYSSLQAKLGFRLTETAVDELVTYEWTYAVEPPVESSEAEPEESAHVTAEHGSVGGKLASLFHRQ
jgi:class 3 adenylate cyclase